MFISISGEIQRRLEFWLKALSQVWFTTSGQNTARHYCVALNSVSSYAMWESRVDFVKNPPACDASFRQRTLTTCFLYDQDTGMTDFMLNSAPKTFAAELRVEQPACESLQVLSRPRVIAALTPFDGTLCTAAS